ncbi:MAG: hypothetical protein ACT4QD_07080 [Acidobacteriota bacterium]
MQRTFSLLVPIALIPSAALVFFTPAWAQDEHRATVLLRNGDRVAGTLEDVENGVVYVRVSLDDQRKLPLDTVALIDLAGGASGLPETELSVARNADHLVLLRDGSSLKGRFVDIRGGEATAAPGEAHLLLFRAGNGEDRRVTLDDVSRIYFGNFPAPAAATTAPAEPGYTAGGELPPGAVRVPANTAWVPTNLTVRKGDRVLFNVTGKIQLSDDAGDLAHAAGSLRQRYATGSPLPQNFAGALIARVGGSTIPIGDVQTPVTMPADGQLWLGVNDDEVSDNKGEFTVTLNRVPSRR